MSRTYASKSSHWTPPSVSRKSSSSFKPPTVGIQPGTGRWQSTEETAGWRAPLPSEVGKSYLSNSIQTKCDACEGKEKGETPEVQTKLTVGEPGDKYEQEADATAAKVVKQINSPGFSESVQTKVEPVAKPTVMRHGGVSGGGVDPGVEQSIQGARGSGQGLSETIKEPMERAFGADFSGVRVHTNGNANQLNRSLHSRAFATGQDIFFKQGEYNPGSGEGQELIAHELTHVVQQNGEQIQRDVIETKTDYKKYNELKIMSLSALDSYAKAQADWHSSPDLKSGERDTVRLILGFAREKGILASCGSHKVEELKTEIDKTNFAEVSKYLQIYSQAVTSQNPFRLGPKKKVTEALKDGTAIEKLLSVMPVPVLKTAMNEIFFKYLVTLNYVDDIVNYYKIKPTPIFQATNGADVHSFIIMKQDDGVDPTTYAGTNLQGKVRNYHRFKKDALDKLKLNYADTSKKKPLTLILHTAIDHNGAFHREDELKDVITNTNIHVLMIEGKETLDDVKSEITPLAKAYGQNDKLDQVMFAGHGNARSIQMAGKVEEDTDEFKKDGKTPNPNYGKLKEVSDAIDLKNNEAKANEIFDEVLKNMDIKLGGPSSSPKQPHRRILFNACLTNSNAVGAIKAKDADKAREEIRNYIKNNMNLVDHLQSRANSKNGDNIGVRGSVASHGAVGLIDGGDNLDLISTDDPKITAPKLEYMEFGKEPAGVLRAALESWAAADPAEQKKCFEAMERRSKKGSKEWDDVIIETLYKLILNAFKDNAQAIQLFSQAAGIISHLQLDAECRVRSFSWMDGWKSVATDLFKALSTSNQWKAYPYIPLVFYQVWMSLDASQMAAFTQHLDAHFTCQTAQKYVDIGYLKDKGHLSGLLKGAATDGKLKLALLGILADSSQSDCKAYLTKILVDDKFSDSGKISTCLDGLDTPDGILIAIGKLQPPDVAPVAVVPSSTDEKANVTIAGEAKNTVHVQSVTKKGRVTKTKLQDKKTGTNDMTKSHQRLRIPASAQLYTKPDKKSNKLGDLNYDEEINILGVTGLWYAIEHTSSSSALTTAFIEKTDVTII